MEQNLKPCSSKSKSPSFSVYKQEIEERNPRIMVDLNSHPTYEGYVSPAQERQQFISEMLKIFIPKVFK